MAAIMRKVKRNVCTNWRAIVLCGIVLTILLNWIFSERARESLVFREGEEDYMTKATYDFQSYPDYAEALAATYVSSEENVVVMALVDSGFIDMAYNFYQQSIVRHKIHNFLFVSLDHVACERLQIAFPQSRVKCFVYKELPTAVHASIYDSREFKEKIYLRRFLILQAIRLGYHVLLTDLDMIYVRNPIKDVKQTCHKKSCDIAAQWDEHLEKYNAGFIYVRPTNASIKFYHRLAKYELSHGVGQMALNAAIREHKGRKNAPSVVPLAQAKYRIGITTFPRNTCPDHKSLRDAIAIHNNYILEQHNKIMRLKECMMWDWDGQAYYSSYTRRYIAVNFAGHLPHHEHETLLNAFSLGKVLARTVILPRFECKSAGKCSLLQRIYDHSHLHFVKRFHNVSEGNYRESSFLQNPRVPEPIRHSVSPVYHISLHNDVPPPKASTVLTLTPKNAELGPSMKELMHWFGQSRDKVLHFDSLAGHMGYLDHHTILGSEFTKVIRQF